MTLTVDLDKLEYMSLLALFNAISREYMISIVTFNCLNSYMKARYQADYMPDTLKSYQFSNIETYTEFVLTWT